MLFLSRALPLPFVLATGAFAWSGSHGPPYGPPWTGGSEHLWNLRKFKTLVAFGDSYTDLNRLDYFIGSGGKPPPVGWVDPGTSNSADGGRPWASYVGQYSGAKVYNYAVAGAVCSNDITPRYLPSINEDFPAVSQYEVPAYIADSKYFNPDGMKFMDDSPDSTVYAIFIGTNDLGNGAFLTHNQVVGKSIPDYVDCVYDSLSAVYANGGRYFVIFNVAPLELTPQYGLPGKGGLASSQYYPDKPADITGIYYQMLEEVTTVNAIYQYRTPFEVELAKKYPGAKFANYDVYGLLTDIYNNPSDYLNGSAPLNVTSYINQCHNGTCVLNSSPDSYMWFDELHPSEQTDRIIAREFVNVVKGVGKWATYWTSGSGY